MAICGPYPSQAEKRRLHSNESPRSSSRRKHRPGPNDERQVPGQRRRIQCGGQLDEARRQGPRGHGQTLDWHHSFRQKNSLMVVPRMHEEIRTGGRAPISEVTLPWFCIVFSAFEFQALPSGGAVPPSSIWPCCVRTNFDWRGRGECWTQGDTRPASLG